MADLQIDVTGNANHKTSQQPAASGVSEDKLASKKAVLQKNSAKSQIQTSSSFLPDDGSLLSKEVDRWIRGCESSTLVSTGVQKSRLAVNQQWTITSQHSSPRSRFYRALKLLIPLTRTRQRALWICSRRALISALEPLLTQIGRMSTRLQAQFQSFTSDQVIQEVFTIIFDIILIVYSIGFLFISLYRSSMTL